MFKQLTDGRISPFFRAAAADAITPGSCRLSEELLFTQSNVRVLLGHSPLGVMRFITLPTIVYPAPVSNAEKTGAMDYWAGTYYQTDQVMLIGNLRFQLEMEDGTVFDAIDAGCENHTGYVSDVLPVSFSKHHDLEVKVASCAPLAKNGTTPFFKSAPLPGPAGALFTLSLKNLSRDSKQIRVRLLLDPVVIDTYRLMDMPLPRYPGSPNRYIRQETMIFQKPEGFAGVHMKHGQWQSLEGPPVCERTVLVSPEEEVLTEVQVALSVNYAELMPTIYELNLLECGEWLNRTLAFWSDRIGDLRLFDENKPFMEKTRDLYVRCIIDNFNCLQVDAEGRLISHWQGAPSHCCGTVWGIDIEPTALSVLSVCPELSFKVLEFFSNRSRSPVPKYPDHSTPILIAPLIIAGAYYKATGDLVAFQKSPSLMEDLNGILNELMTFKAKSHALFSSHYSSDGRVFRKYDHGTNVKVFTALSGYSELLAALGKIEIAADLQRLCKELKQDLLVEMTAEGPFGKQISGGTNLSKGTEDGFYLEEDFLYYDGEDSTSCMAPLSGIYNFNQPEWVHYHQFAQSLWCTNFDPEFSAVRWFHDGGPLDGTAFIARVGGSHTREAMREALEALFEYDCDQTGSVYWWPFGKNNCRGITRCSQGQGAWVQQFQQQWLGISIDAAKHQMLVRPSGLPAGIAWKRANFYGNLFNISWHEHEGSLKLEVQNLNRAAWSVRLIGGSSPEEQASGKLEAGSRLALTVQCPAKHEGPCKQSGDIIARELEAFANADGIIFDTFDNRLVQHKMWDGRLWVLVRFVLSSVNKLEDVRVTLRLPAGNQVKCKREQVWELPENKAQSEDEYDIGDICPASRRVAAFWVRLDKAPTRAVRFDTHSFAEASSTALFSGVLTGEMKAVMRYSYKGRRHQLTRTISLE